MASSPAHLFNWNWWWWIIALGAKLEMFEVRCSLLPVNFSRFCDNYKDTHRTKWINHLIVLEHQAALTHVTHYMLVIHVALSILKFSLLFYVNFERKTEPTYEKKATENIFIDFMSNFIDKKLYCSVINSSILISLFVRCFI